MTKTELVYTVANKTQSSKTSVEKMLAAVFDTIGEEMRKGEKVSISGFGTFEPASRSARTGRNPATGEPMQISESKTVKFHPAKNLKDRIK